MSSGDGTERPLTTQRTPTATHWGTYEVTSRDGRVVGVEPMDDDPAPSPIGAGMPAALYDPVRLTKPMVRRDWLEQRPREGRTARGSGPFVETSWDDAVELVANELNRVKCEHGCEAIYGGSYGWGSAGRFHHAQSQLHRFLKLHGGYTASVNSYSMAALEVIMPHVIGGSRWAALSLSPLWEEVVDHGELVLAFGGMARKNSQVNSGGVGVHDGPGLQQRCRDAGVKFVNISPIRYDVGEGLDAQWLPLRPNSDVALMLGIAHTLVSEDLHDREFLARCCEGFERFSAYLLGATDGIPKNADWAARITEIDASVIRSLARRIATRRTLISVAWSLQRADHGEQPYWMGVTLAAMSGSLGRPGGGFAAGLGAVHSLGVERARWPVAGLPQGDNPITTFVPVARVTDMLLGPGETDTYNGATITYPDIKIVYWCGGNPFHHQQDLNRLVRAWQHPDTVIVHEAWWTPLARFADIVLPVATALERNDFAAGMHDLWITPMHRAAEAPGEARTDYEAFTALAERLGFEDAFTEGRDEQEWIRYLYEETRQRLDKSRVSIPEFEEFWRASRIRTPRINQPAEGDFALLREDPRKHALATPSGRLEIFSEVIDGFGYEDCPGHPTWLEPAEWLGGAMAERYGLHLISNQPRTRLHSQFDNGALSKASKVGGREPIRMNAADAAARGIQDGDVVRVFNDRGACLAGVRTTDALRPGVVELSTGAWYDPAEPGVPGSLDRHGNPNVLTRDKGTSSLAQGPTPGTTLVEIERFHDSPPPVEAFSPPPIVRGR